MSNEHEAEEQVIHLEDRAAKWRGLMETTGGNRDEFVLRLFERLEELEPILRNAVTMERRLSNLNEAVNSISRAVVAEEERGSRLGRSLDRLRGRLGSLEHWAGKAANAEVPVTQLQPTAESVVLHRIIETLELGFSRIIERLPVPPPPVCGAASRAGNAIGEERCELPAGHDGRHYQGTLTWPNRDAELHTPVEPLLPASSPAARCIGQLADGQCMGYAGHDGECSAVPDSGPQIESAGEFAPVGPVCGALDPGGVIVCQLEPNHLQQHRGDGFIWGERCHRMVVHPDKGTCTLAMGHPGACTTKKH